MELNFSSFWSVQIKEKLRLAFFPFFFLVLLLTPPDTEEPETEMEKDDQKTSLHPKSHDVPGIK